MPGPELTTHDVQYDLLLRVDVGRQLPGAIITTEEQTLPVSYSRLLEWASYMAFGSSDDQTLAYNIVSRVTQNDPSPVNVSAAEFVLSRLGNFPGRDLASRMFPESDITRVKPFSLLAETLARQVENTPEDVGSPLTDFQSDLLSMLETSRSVSVSAPTSAGKTYALSIAVRRLLRSNATAIAVYVVPTRALVSEVMSRIADNLRANGLGDVPVRCTPFLDTAPEGPMVLVFTQERLTALLSSDTRPTHLDMLIIDEAQGLKDGARGVVLHSAIDIVTRSYPTATIFFASPLSRNPEYLLTLFDRAQIGTYRIERVSPVSQNLILVKSVVRKPRQAQFSLLEHNRTLDLGLRDLDFALRNSTIAIRANFARAVTRSNETTIIYCNGPAETEDVCEALMQGVDAEPDLDQEMAELMEFITEHVHPQYSLSSYLPYRIAYHYGHMPANVRARVEALARSGKLRYVCCTSTLLQGVNLPAKHIVICKPTRGPHVPMSRADFLNLAGRAGRLAYEFQGNVWCLMPEEWENDCYEGDRLQDITAAYSEAMADGGTIIGRVLRGEVKGPDADTGAAVAGKYFNDEILSQHPVETSRFATDNNLDQLRHTAAELGRITVTLPHEIFARNPTVLPTGLEELHAFLAQQDTVRDYFPMLPEAAGSYDRLATIFRCIEDYLQKSGTERHRYFTLLADRWMRGTSLREIINQHIAHEREHAKFRSVDHTIRSVLESIEEDLQFKSAKYLRAYLDVLSHTLREKNMTDEIEHLVPIHLFVEYGTSNPTVLKLLSIGLSRATALLLVRDIEFGEDPSTSEISSLVKRHYIRLERLPAVCKSEIRSLLGA